MEKSQVSCSRTGSKAERERALQWVGWPASFIPKNKSSIKQGLHHQAHSWIPACESSSRPIYPSVITKHWRHFKWSGKTITPQVHSSPLQYRWELLRYDRKLFEHYHGIKMHMYIYFSSSFFFYSYPTFLSWGATFRLSSWRISSCDLPWWQSCLHHRKC